MLASFRSSTAAHHHHGHGKHAKPTNADDLAALIRETRAAFADAALTNAQLTTSGEEGLTDAQVRRWLAARGWDPARAAHDLAAHAAWRAGMVPAGGRVPEAEVAAQVAQQKVLYQGNDRHGRPVVVLIGGNHIPRPNQTIEIQKFYCYAADACIANADLARNPEGRVVFILDVGDFGWKNFDVLGAKALLNMIHQHYVERLSTVYFHNASAVMLQLYKLVAPFIDPITREKVVFLPRDPAAAGEVLARDIDLHLLPPNLGGLSAPRPVEDAWAEYDARCAAAAAAAAKAAAEEAEAEADASATIAAGVASLQFSPIAAADDGNNNNNGDDDDEYASARSSDGDDAGCNSGSSSAASGSVGGSGSCASDGGASDGFASVVVAVAAPAGSSKQQGASDAGAAAVADAACRSAAVSVLA